MSDSSEGNEASESDFGPVETSPTFPVQGIEIVLRHKPRGSKGVWQNVTQGEKLRVTPGKGKCLKLNIQTLIQDPSTKVQILLVDNDNNGHCKSSDYALEPTKSLNEFQVKVFKLSKRLQFLCEIHDPATQALIASGKSIEFATHNGAVAKQSPSPPSYPQPQPEEAQTTVVPGNLDVQGNVRARAFFQFSDIRLKTNLEDIVDAIGIVSNLSGKTYEWKKGVGMEESQGGGRKVLGLIAQEVQRVLPEVVHEDAETGILTVSYTEIIPVLIQAFKEFMMEYKADSEEVQQRIKGLHEAVDKLSTQFKAKDYHQFYYQPTPQAVVQPQVAYYPQPIVYSAPAAAVVVVAEEPEPPNTHQLRYIVLLALSVVIFCTGAVFVGISFAFAANNAPTAPTAALAVGIGGLPPSSGTTGSAPPPIRQILDTQDRKRKSFLGVGITFVLLGTIGTVAFAILLSKARKKAIAYEKKRAAFVNRT